jgi:hypothetical protein
MLIADITYAVDTGEKLVNETFGPGNIHRRSSGTYEARPMPIRDGRLPTGTDADALSLDTSGFMLVSHPTSMTDFFDVAALKAVYYPEVIALIKSVSGAQRVEVFDHTLRSGDETEREAKLLREPVLAAHNDYTEWSGPQRLRELLPDEADALLARRFAIIQVWRAIDRPIVANPLAVADARSVAAADLVISERRYPHRIGQTYRLRHNPAHRWFYFPHMQRDEALVFKVFDSDKGGRARFTPHTSFIDPRTPAGAPPRQSIEVRTLAFF